jgi:hypothetical protein
LDTEARVADLTRALDKLRDARRSIVAVAAAWQARGIETEPLNLPLIHIQEAITEIESSGLEAAAPMLLHLLGRDLVNQFNAVRVSGAGLETEGDPDKRLHWLDLLDQAADRCISTLDRMRPLMQDEV